MFRYLLLLFLALATACKKNEVQSDQKALLSFSFTKSANPSLIADVSGMISGSQVTIMLPAGTKVNALKATFSSSPLSTVSIGGMRQESGVTSNDFTSPVIYRITAEDGSTVDYSVKVAVAKSGEKLITAFSFLKSANPELPSDISFTINGTQFAAVLPVGQKAIGLKASFTVSPLAIVTVNGAKQENGMTSNDFSTPLTYRVTAEDGSSTDYTATVTVQVPVLSAAKDLLNFSLIFKSFSSKEIESTGKISAQKISLFLPPNTNIQNVKPTFTISDKATVQVNGQNQSSGQSAIDLSKPVLYRVIAEDKTTKDYEVTGISIDQTIDNLLQKFMTQYSVTGLSFSMTRNERLVYSKGYGLADKSTNEAVNVNSLFRVASVSKPITAIAIMKLIEEGKLSLDSKVFGAGSIFGTKYGAAPYLSGYESITVKQILEHTSGLATNDSNDPMGISAFDLTQDQVIDNTVRTRALLATPGTKYSYSNFGYCVLGRIIEKVSGTSYINYLQENIFTPSGISTIQVTGNTINTRKPNEVIYYNSKYNPYGINVARMDSHGGLIASSIDLVKLLTRVDGFAGKADILKPETINTMTKYNATAGYSLGWSVNSSNNWWHTGSIQGTSSEIVRANNGFSWAIITNSGCIDCGDNYWIDLDQLGWQIQSLISQWPEYDLF
ncbi:serine hydrolase [Spirosoma sp. BT702]|uniref:Serine hydrolase n=1 Tax=Spirosoma profusum TaxID=2771354 RepID=A0A927AU10_9BACT|nr:serine hydrolase [Spirosoma profusum]MBD2701862.1 serine hydrolase [Spirosoma profusum]